jgi:CRISPR-associated protein Cmr3
MTPWTLFLEPLTVLRIRDHRPFFGGLHSTASTIFPPPTSVLGALRTALMLDAGADFDRGPDFGLDDEARAWLGGRDDRGTLTLRGPIPARLAEGGVEPLFPEPLDLYQTPSNVLRRREAGLLQDIPPELRPVAGSAQAVPWTRDRVEKRTLPPCLVTCAGAQRYLNGEALRPQAGDLVPRDKVYATEPRTGVARDPEARTVIEAMFYTVETLRFADRAGIVVEVDIPTPDAERRLQALNGRTLPLGGKAQRVKVHVVERPLLPDDLTSQSQPTRAWLLTPLIGEADRLTAATDRGLPAGGWDLARRQPRPLRPVWPAGTVFYLQPGATGLSTHQQPDDTKAGYGFALLGG